MVAEVGSGEGNRPSPQHDKSKTIRGSIVLVSVGFELFLADLLLLLFLLLLMLHSEFVAVVVCTCRVVLTSSWLLLQLESTGLRNKSKLPNKTTLWTKSCVFSGELGLFPRNVAFQESCLVLFVFRLPLQKPSRPVSLQDAEHTRLTKKGPKPPLIVFFSATSVPQCDTLIRISGGPMGQKGFSLRKTSTRLPRKCHPKNPCLAENLRESSFPGLVPH